MIAQDVRNVEAFNPARDRVEAKQAFEFSRRLPVQGFVAEMIGNGGSRVLFGEENQLMLGASLGGQDAHAVAAFLAQPLFDQRGLVESRGHQQFLGRLPFLVVELLDGRAHEFLVARVGGLGPEEILSSDQQASAHEQELEIRRGALTGESDYILVGCADLGDALFFQRTFDAEESIPQPGRLLERFPFRRPLHVFTQAVQQFPVPPFEKLANLFDDLMVFVPRLVTGAGSHAAFDLELDAGPVGPAVDIDFAGGQRKRFADHLQCFAERPGRSVGAVVECPVFLHPPDDGESRKVFFDR